MTTLPPSQQQQQQQQQQPGLDQSPPHPHSRNLLISVTAQNVSFFLPYRRWLQKLVPRSFRPEVRDFNVTGSPVDPREGFELLRNINVVAHPHQLTAILGPSGCGKTTLLNILGQRAQGRMTGSIAYNNVLASHRALKGCVSMCYANDRLLPYLTVEETLFFATILKMGQCTAAERKERVENVLQELALDHVRHTRIGGIWGKGISSGEVRRTAIGVELIGDPAVLLLDEPTSGLDAVLAFEIMFVLKCLASKGRTVICAVHQPRAAIFDLFDSLVLMSDGQVLYHGRPSDARPWLHRHLDVPQTERMNVADALIDIAHAASSCDNAKESKGSSFTASAIAKTFIDSQEMQTVQAAITEARQRESPLRGTSDRNQFVQWFVEIGAICFRSFRNSMRNPLSCAMVLAIQGLMGCFLGAIFFKLPSKFLPEVVPPDIGSEQSDVMFMFNNSLATLFTTGIDGSGYNPFVELLVSGVDGNASEPFQLLADRGVLRSLYNSMDCVHERLELEDCYESVDFTQFYDLWGTSSAGDEEWAGGSDFSTPIMTSYLLKIFQVFDYSLGKYDYDNLLRMYRPLSGVQQGAFLFLPVVCVTALRELSSAFSDCSGISVLPNPSGPMGNSLASYCGALASLPKGETSVKTTFRCEDVVLDGEVKRADLVGTADRASAHRRLQAAALISGGNDIKEALPPVLLNIINRLPDYQEAFSECPHEFCQLLQDQMNDSDGTIQKSITALSDYGSVLGAIMNIVGALFFSIANIGFAAYDALITFPQERAMINREMKNYAYRPSSYFIGKSLADMVFQLAPAMLLITAFYFLVGVELGDNAVVFWRYLGICALTVFAAYGFTYLVSALSPSMEVAVVGAPVVLVVFLCCSGFFVRDSGVPDWLQWLKYLSFYRWGFFALIVNQFKVGESYGGIPNSFSLAVAGISERRISVCCAALIALGVGFRFLAYLALRFLHRKIGTEQ